MTYLDDMTLGVNWETANDVLHKLLTDPQNETEKQLTDAILATAEHDEDKAGNDLKHYFQQTLAREGQAIPQHHIDRYVRGLHGQWEYIR